jgi:hypothetical protein
MSLYCCKEKEGKKEVWEQRMKRGRSRFRDRN